MAAFARWTGILIVCLLAVATTSCSNNSGKIVGKWQAQGRFADDNSGATVLEFTSDGRYIWSIGNDEILTAKYSLGAGDSVTLRDVSLPQKGGFTKVGVKVTIKGDTMTWKQDDGTFTLTRIGGGAAPAPGK